MKLFVTLERNSNRNTSKIMRYIKVESDFAHFPCKAHLYDAAFDLKTSERAYLKSNSRLFVPLGFKIELPSDVALLIQPRSGMSGKGMVALADIPLLGISGIKLRVNADVIVGLVDCKYGKIVNAIVKVGPLRLKHRIMKLLGARIYIPENSRICQGRLVDIPKISLIEGNVKGERDGLGSTGY